MGVSIRQRLLAIGAVTWLALAPLSEFPGPWGKFLTGLQALVILGVVSPVVLGEFNEPFDIDLWQATTIGAGIAAFLYFLAAIRRQLRLMPKKIVEVPNRNALIRVLTKVEATGIKLIRAAGSAVEAERTEDFDVVVQQRKSESAVAGQAYLDLRRYLLAIEGAVSVGLSNWEYKARARRPEEQIFRLVVYVIDAIDVGNPSKLKLNPDRVSGRK